MPRCDCRRCGISTSVRIYLEKGAQRGAVIVVIDVTENSPIAMEWIAGGSFRLEGERTLTGGRIAHQNLFGEGKFADLTAVAVVPFGGEASTEAYEVCCATPIRNCSIRVAGLASPSQAGGSTTAKIFMATSRISIRRSSIYPSDGVSLTSPTSPPG